MIELGGKRVIRIWARSVTDPGTLAQVKEQMKELGRPTITCVDWRGELYALAGRHRLRAAFDLGICPNIEVTGPDRFHGEDEQYWDWVQKALTDYSWEVVASFQFGD